MDESVKAGAGTGTLRLFRRIYVGVVGVLMLAFSFADDHPLLQAVLFLVITALAPLFMFFAIRRQPRQRSRPWWLLFAGLVMIALAYVPWYIYPVATGRALDFPSFGDALFYIAYATLIAGGTGLVRARSTDRDQAGALDTCIVALGLGSLAWVFLIEPQVGSASTSWFGEAVSIGYTLFDVILAAVAVRLFLLPGRKTAPVIAVVLWTVVQLTADASYGSLAIHGRFEFGAPYFLLWVTGYTLLAWASAHPDAAVAVSAERPEDHSLRAAPNENSGVLRVAFLGAAAFIPSIALIVLEASGESQGPALAVFSVAVFVLVLLRLGSLVLDVAERERIESELSTFHSIVQHSHDAILSKDLNGTVRSWNPGAESLYGFSAAEMIGRTAAPLVPKGLEADDEAALEVARTGTPISGLETKRRRKDGSIVDVQLTVSPQFDRDGKAAGISVVSQDITARKRAESAEHERTTQLERSNAELEQFAYVASHDLQEPLRMVSSYVQLLARRYRERLDETAIEFIDYAVDGVDRMQQLINDLLAFSRAGRSEEPFAPVSLQSVVDTVCRNLESSLKDANATVAYSDLPTVVGDKVQLTQPFQNLIANAVKFRNERDPFVEVLARSTEDGWEISVRDNGIGIEEQYLDRIFVMFQRLHTRDEYQGTGIGLAICKKIVERHGGSLRVQSELGVGTTFAFSIPNERQRDPNG